MKIWLIGIVTSFGVSLFSKSIRAKYCAVLSHGVRFAYSWLLNLPARIDLSKLSPENQAKIKRGYKLIVTGFVMIEEALLPDSGLGADKKAAVLNRLKIMGVPTALAEQIDGMIEDGVGILDKEAKDFIEQQEVPLPPETAEFAPPAIAQAVRGEEGGKLA